MADAVKKRSAVTFVRKQLGFRGRSQHNGRGVFECECQDEYGEDVGLDALLTKAQEKIPMWQAKGLVEMVSDTERYLTIVFKAEPFGDYYRTLCVPKKAQCFIGYGILC